jgi:hypothetical protein
MTARRWKEPLPASSVGARLALDFGDVFRLRRSASRQRGARQPSSTIIPYFRSGRITTLA